MDKKKRTRIHIYNRCIGISKVKRLVTLQSVLKTKPMATLDTFILAQYKKKSIQLFINNNLINLYLINTHQTNFIA